MWLDFLEGFSLDLFHNHQVYVITILIQLICMQNKDKVIDFYHSGRYQCDLHFHIYLRDILLQMNIYDWDVFIEQQINTLHKIKELTEINAKCLEEDYDDEQGICQTYKIKSLINQLSSKSIPAIIDECQQLHWEPYSSKIKTILKGQPQYQSILQRIDVSVHSQQFRIDSMLFTAFFYEMHGNSLQQCIQLYSHAIQYYLNYLNKKKCIVDTLFEASEYSNVLKLQKTKEFIGTLFFVLRSCLRFCQIIKILTGKNNLSLKFTVARKEIQKTVKKYPEWKSFEQKEELFAVLALYKRHLKSREELQREKVCRWCFKEMREPIGEHQFCSSLILKKELFV